MCRSFYHQPDASLIELFIAYALSVQRETALQALISQASLDLAEVPPKLTMPTVVVRGRYDQARPIAHAEWLVKHLPCVELLLLDCGHTHMVEMRSACAQAVQRLCTLVKISS